MYAKPSLYDRANFLQFRDGSKLIQRIKQDLKQNKMLPLNTVLDIGCGSGNLTERLYQELKPKRVIAFDIDHKMVEYARKRHMVVNEKGEPGIEYHQANACQPFPELAKQLQVVPQSVDLVVSFYCLHWVPDNQIVCHNIHQFLKPQGKVYILFSVWNDLFPIQHQIVQHPTWNAYLRQKLFINPDDDKSIANFDVKKKPKEEEVFEKWHKYFFNGHLMMHDISFTYTTYEYFSANDFFDQVESACYWLDIIPESMHREFLADYHEHIREKFIRPQMEYQKCRKDQLGLKDPIGLFRFPYEFAVVFGEKLNEA